MSTYRVQALDTPALACPLLVCERCARPVAIPSSPADLAGVSAEVVSALWPELAPAVERHERECAAQPRS